MAPNDSSSSHQKLTGKEGFTVRTNKHGVKHVCFAKPSRTGEERATRDTSRVQGSSNSMHSNSSSSTMNTAAENPFSTPDSSSQSANMGPRAVSSRDDVPPSSQQMNVDAVHRPRPSSSEGERTRRLHANGLPFFPNSFLRYHQAQKNYEKLKKNKAESGKDKRA